MHFSSKENGDGENQERMLAVQDAVGPTKPAFRFPFHFWLKVQFVFRDPYEAVIPAKAGIHS
jgi:hypothetical protein